MPLPVAQLGYMPNINTPGGRSKYQVEDPWEKLAVAVLAQAAGGAVGNLMSRDYASQATAENPEQVTAMPAVSPATGQAQPGNPTPLGPQNAPWWSKMLQGPQMGERQYAQVGAQRAGAAEGRADRSFKEKEGTAQRGLVREEGAADRAIRDRQVAQAGEQFTKGHQLDTKRLGLQEQVAQQDNVIKSGGLLLDAKNANTRANPPADPDTLKRVIGTMASDVYKTRMEQWSRAAAFAQANGQQPPPQPTFDQAVNEAATAAQKFLSPQNP